MHIFLRVRGTDVRVEHTLWRLRVFIEIWAVRDDDCEIRYGGIGNAMNVYTHTKYKTKKQNVTVRRGHTQQDIRCSGWKFLSTREKYAVVTAEYDTIHVHTDYSKNISVHCSHAHRWRPLGLEMAMGIFPCCDQRYNTIVWDTTQ